MKNFTIPIESASLWHPREWSFNPLSCKSATANEFLLNRICGPTPVKRPTAVDAANRGISKDHLRRWLMRHKLVA